MQGSLFVAIILSFHQATSWWHVYDWYKKLQPQCRKYYNISKADWIDTPWNNGTLYQPNTVSDSILKKWKLWPGLISERALKYGETIFGLQKAMDTIWNHQHPNDCSQAKFLIAEGWAQGFGSEVHVLGLGLAVAMNLNRVLVMNPEHAGYQNIVLDNRWQVNNSFCKSRNKVNLECYYEPWTHCDIKYIMNNKTMSEYKLGGSKTYIDELSAHENRSNLLTSEERTIVLHSNAEVLISTWTPEVLYALITCSPMKSVYYSHWWRSISAAYILRPNQDTLKLIDFFRRKHSSQALKTINYVFPTTTNSINHSTTNSHTFASTFPQPYQGCISIHVRHGDKHCEAPLVGTHSYMKLARFLGDHHLVLPYQNSQLLFNQHYMDYRHHIKSKRSAFTSSLNHTIISLFLGSEDPNAFEIATNWSLRHNWTLSYTNLFDRNTVSTFLNSTQQENLKKQKKFIHHEWEYFSMILNLDYHLRCDTFICTSLSNYCRLIDELKATVANKANFHYADLSTSCEPFEFCIDEHFQHDWRRH